MEINNRSTSALMTTIFGSDTEMILPIYDERIRALSERYPFLSTAWADCFRRTSFLLPYMCCEYAYHSIKGEFMPKEMKETVANFAMICLVTGIDDDIVDEYSREGNHLKLVVNSSVSEALQNSAYSDLVAGAGASTVLEETRRFLHSVWKYQYLDSVNITTFPTTGFDLSRYLEACHKTACYTVHGLRLGVALAGGSESDIKRAEALGKPLGQTLQFYDDLLDLPEDIVNYSYPVTLPMLLLKEGKDFSQIHNLITSNLDGAFSQASLFGKPEKVGEMVAGFGKARELVSQRMLAR